MSRENDQIVVTDNTAEQRYEAHVDGKVAILTYKRDGDHITLVHTEVPPALEGRGIGGALARTALEDARADKLDVIPLCSYVAAYIRRHKEYLPLVPEQDRERLLGGK